MLTIRMKNNQKHQYKSNQYTDYEMRKDWFIVSYENQWIGAYSTSEMVSFEVTDDEGRKYSKINDNVD